ncbi:MAG: hypothetical protein ACR2RF_25420 [Geminicoccaceae bacterium]
MKPIIILMFASLALGACGAKEKIVTMTKSGIAYYCNAGEAERSALRQQFMTSKGPLAQVNCENLE